MPEGRAKKQARRQEHSKVSLRAKVEHQFRVIKRQFGLTKVRFKGLAKNTAHVLTLFALSNLWRARKKLMSMRGEVRVKPARGRASGVACACGRIYQCENGRRAKPEQHP